MASGSDEKISGTKITPLESETKHGVEHDLGNRGAVGTNESIDKSRANPLGGAGMFPFSSLLLYILKCILEHRWKVITDAAALTGQYQHPNPHADSSGVIGPDKNVEQAKIQPLSGQSDGTKTVLEGDQRGLTEEAVDSARIAPVGEVREEMNPPR